MAKESTALSVLLNPDKGNVLVVGNSGVGKSTLINSVLGDNYTVTSHQPKGVTSALHIYENDYLPLRLIDTIGFEDDKKQTKEAIKAIHKWIKESAKKKDVSKIVNEIWFCVDGTSSRLFVDTIKKLEKATSLWETVPIIIVITKSYSSIEREDNINMVHQALSEYDNQELVKRVKKVIPVVAKSYQISEDVFVVPDGISALVEETIALMPTGKLRATEGMAKFNAFANMKKAQAIVAGSAAAAAASGALPGGAGTKLNVIEKQELLQIAKVYGMAEHNHGVQQLLNYLVDKGFVAQVARTVIKLVEGLPIHTKLTSTVTNSIIAAGFVVALGQAEIFIFDQVARGKKSFDDMSWATDILEKQATIDLIDRVQNAFVTINKELTKDKKVKPSQIVSILMDAFLNAPGGKKKKTASDDTTK